MRGELESWSKGTVFQQREMVKFQRSNTQQRDPSESCCTVYLKRATKRGLQCSDWKEGRKGGNGKYVK